MGTLSAGALIKLTATQEISPDRWVHLEQGEVRGRFTPEGFVLSFLTKLAQAELRGWLGLSKPSSDRTPMAAFLFHHSAAPAVSASDKRRTRGPEKY